MIVITAHSGGELPDSEIRVQKTFLRSPCASEGEFAVQTRPNSEFEVAASGH